MNHKLLGAAATALLFALNLTPAYADDDDTRRRTEKLEVQEGEDGRVKVNKESEEKGHGNHHHDEHHEKTTEHEEIKEHQGGSEHRYEEHHEEHHDED